MFAAMPASNSPPAGAAPSRQPPLRLFQAQNPATALGLVVSHLMTRTPFAQLPMGAWCRILVGQINRRHYQLVLDDRNRVVGFLGWAMTSEEQAEAWLRGGRGTLDAEGTDGDCIVFNAWAADTAAINRFILGAARVAMHGRRLIYSKRYYRDGRIRPLRLSVNDFVEQHIGRGRAG